MKKIELKDYNVKVIDNEGKKKELPYKVKDTMVTLLFHPELKLGGRDLLLTHKLATKIDECKEDFILLEDSEYMKLKRAVETIKGLGRNEVELVERILEAEDAEVEEKKEEQDEKTEEVPAEE